MENEFIIKPDWVDPNWLKYPRGNLELTSEISEWCKDNLYGNYSICLPDFDITVFWTIIFERVEDAIYFKLRWG